MAAQSLSTPPTTTRAQAQLPGCRETHPVYSSILTQNVKPNNLKSPWLGTSKLSLHSSILRPILPEHSPITATVVFSLPTATPEKFSSDKVPKWSSKAIKSFAMGELEARKLKYGTTGTEALLMGILIEGTSQASKFLRANGITHLRVREETVKLLGKADMYYFSPEHPPLTEAAQTALDWAINEKSKSGMNGGLVEYQTCH